jgi:hypothetical protein
MFRSHVLPSGLRSVILQWAVSKIKIKITIGFEFSNIWSFRDGHQITLGFKSVNCTVILSTHSFLSNPDESCSLNLHEWFLCASIVKTVTKNGSLSLLKGESEDSDQVTVTRAQGRWSNCGLSADEPGLGPRGSLSPPPLLSLSLSLSLSEALSFLSNGARLGPLSHRDWFPTRTRSSDSLAEWTSNLGGKPELHFHLGIFFHFVAMRRCPGSARAPARGGADSPAGGGRPDRLALIHLDHWPIWIHSLNYEFIVKLWIHIWISNYEFIVYEFIYENFSEFMAYEFIYENVIEFLYEFRKYEFTYAFIYESATMNS